MTQRKCPTCGQLYEVPEHRSISGEMVRKIQNWEGLRLKAYKCPAGVWTIGYGHTGIVHGSMIDKNTVITEDEAEVLLRADLVRFEDGVSSGILVPLTGHQFDACVSLSFNVGLGWIRKYTGRLLNAGNYRQASDRFLRYNKANGKVLKGLTKRREVERDWFNTPDVEDKP